MPEDDFRFACLAKPLPASAVPKLSNAAVAYIVRLERDYAAQNALGTPGHMLELAGGVVFHTLQRVQSDLAEAQVRLEDHDEVIRLFRLVQRMNPSVFPVASAKKEPPADPKSEPLAPVGR